MSKYQPGDRVEIMTTDTRGEWVPATVVEPPPIDRRSAYTWTRPDTDYPCKFFLPDNYYYLNIPCNDQEIRRPT